MSENQDHNNNIQEPKPRKIVKVTALTNSESANVDSKPAGTSTPPVTIFDTNSQRKIYCISAAKVPKTTRTPIILPSGRQGQECSQITPQSSQKPILEPIQVLKQPRRPQLISPIKPPSDPEPMPTVCTASSAITTTTTISTTSYSSTYRSKKYMLIDNKMREMADKAKSEVRPNQFVKNSITNRKGENEEDDTNVIIRSQLPVRVHPHPSRKFSVLSYRKEDVQLCSNEEAFLQRENNLDLYSKSLNKKSAGGACSEFNARKRLNTLSQKRGIRLKEYSVEQQPLLLTVGRGKSARRYRGVKENTLVDSKYFIFTQNSDGGFDAYPVNEWYTVKRRINYNYLNDEEAEREFSKRNKVLNYFNIMKNARQQNADQSAADVNPATVKSGLVLSEFDEWKAYDQSDDEMESEEDEGSDINQIRAQKRLKEKKRRSAAIVASKRRSRITLSRRKHKSNVISAFDDDDDEDDHSYTEMAGEDSDIDDHDGDELDYLTDSTSDEDKLSEDEKEKIYEILGVDEEVGVISDSDEEEGGEDEENEMKEKLDGTKFQQNIQKVGTEIFPDKQEKREESSSSTSSSCSSEIEEDFDEVFQNKISEFSGPSQSFKSFPPSKKRRFEDPLSETLSPPKSFKSNESSLPLGPPSSFKGVRGRLFDAIRKYLLRKPITLEELIRKLRAGGLLGHEEVLNASQVGEVLQLMKPLKQTVCGKAQYYLKY